MSDVITKTRSPKAVIDRLIPKRIQNHVTKLFRYTATSGIALGISEIVLIALFWSKTFNATVSAMIATLAGTVPSYLLSRYCIWANACRTRGGRQVVLY